MSDAKRLTGRTMENGTGGGGGGGLGPVLGHGYQGGDAGGGSEHESPMEGVMKLHRALRGRYVPALILSAIGAVAGGVAGFMSTKPKYESVAQIHIKPLEDTVVSRDEWQDQNAALQTFDALVNTQATIIQSPEIIRQALTSDEWRQIGGENTPEAREAFSDDLIVRVDGSNREWIRVRFPHTNPKVSLVAVQQVTRAYENYLEDLQSSSDSEKFLRQQVRNKEDERKRIIEDLRALTEPYAGRNPRKLQDDLNKELTDLELKAQQAQLTLEEKQAAAVRQGNQPAGGEPVPGQPAGIDVSPERIAMVDPTMADLIRARDAFDVELNRLRRQGLTDRHPQLRKIEANLANAQQAVDRRADVWRANNPGVIPGLNPNDAQWGDLPPEQLQAKVDVWNRQIDDLRQKSAKLNVDGNRYEDLLAKQKTVVEEIASLDKKLEKIQSKSDFESMSKDAGRIKVWSRGEEAVRPTYDNRKKFAMAGFMLGGGLPLGLFLLWGMADRRFRYSDDAVTSNKQPVTLLGILPALPENMTDPEQAGIAAHCVHQIRTLLQLGGRHDAPQVIAITSPTSGDGKTSLAMSLGMSFAASGSRTLLVDFDMIGHGLTRNMNAKTEAGTMAAVDAGTIDGYVIPTAFKRLSLLPTAENDAQEVGRLSPPSVRRLLDQARRGFDVVVVDTGPILGSLEACMVAAQSDGVVLTMGRGQQRSLAERAIKQIQSVGAKLLGVVFNKADPQDFKRSVSSASVRSVPASTNALAVTSNLARGGRMDPVAKVVAATMGHEQERDDDDDRARR